MSYLNVNGSTIGPIQKQFVVNSLIDALPESIQNGDIIHDKLSGESYIYDKTKKPICIASNHGELNFIKTYPDMISHIFEDRLKSLEYLGKDKNEYIQKLIQLRNDLDQLIVRWI